MFGRFKNDLMFTVPLCWSDNLILISFDIQSQFIALKLFVSMFPMLYMISNLLSWLWLHYRHDAYMPKYRFNKPSCCNCFDIYPGHFCSPGSNFDNSSLRSSQLHDDCLYNLYQSYIILSPSFSFPTQDTERQPVDGL